MSQHVDGSRYVLYLPPAKANLDALDNSLRETIEAEIRKFLTAWNPEIVFDKSVTENVGQIKKDRSVVRAFGTWWDGGDVHVLLVLAVYKKNDESAFWADRDRYEELSREYVAELDQRHANDEVERSLATLEQSDDFRLLGE